MASTYHIRKRSYQGGKSFFCNAFTVAGFPFPENEIPSYAMQGNGDNPNIVLHFHDK